VEGRLGRELRRNAMRRLRASLVVGSSRGAIWKRVRHGMKKAERLQRQVHHRRWRCASWRGGELAGSGGVAARDVVVT